MLKVQALGHLQKAAHDVPELVAIQAESNRVGGCGKDGKLTIRYREFLVKIEKIRFGCDAIVFPTRDEHRRQYLQWINDRQSRRHIQIRASRRSVTEFQFRIRHGLGDRWVRSSWLVSSEDAADHISVALPPIMGAIVFDRLGAF